jgi:chaperone modulatory protein CbpM
MNVERTEVLWLEARSDYTRDDLMAMSGLPAELLHGLMECGVLPAGTGFAHEVFEAESVALARAARRLHDAFDLDADGLAVAVTLLQRVRRLEQDVARLRAHTNDFGDEAA